MAPVNAAHIYDPLTPGSRICVHSLGFRAGMLGKGAVRKNHVAYNIQSKNGIWSARCVQWSGRVPIWEVLNYNAYENRN